MSLFKSSKHTFLGAGSEVYFLDFSRDLFLEVKNETHIYIYIYIYLRGIKGYCLLYLYIYIYIYVKVPLMGASDCKTFCS